MLKCNLRLIEMRAGAGLYTSACAQRGCAHTVEVESPSRGLRVKVLGHAIDNS